MFLKSFALGLSLVVLLTLPLAAQGENGHQDSKISHVVVYPQSAEVTRLKEVEVAPGLNVVLFKGLVARLDPGSLRASSADGVEVVGIESRTQYLTEPLSKQLAELDTKVREQAARAKEIEWELARLEEERNFYGTIRTSTLKSIQEAAEGGTLSVEDWKKLIEFVREGTEGMDKARLAVEDLHRIESAELERLKAERARIASAQPLEMKEVTVTLRASKAGKVDVQLHYVVPDASWTPTYDVHLYTGEGRVRFTSYGLVTQATGEGWEEAKITLARARPEYRLAVAETKPTVVSLSGGQIARIVQDVRDFNRAEDQKAWLSTRYSGTTFEGGRNNFALTLNELAVQGEEFCRANGIAYIEVQQALEKLQDRFSGVRYDLVKPETILSDRSAHKVVIFSELLPGELKFVAAPSAEAMVIRKAEVVNATSYAFLEGSSSVFVDGSYVGAGSVPNASANESISLYFGPDDSLKVTRELVKRETKGPERFRQSELVTYEFKIKIENFRDAKVQMELEDQIPISQTDDVQVKFLGSNIEGTKPDEKGILDWDLEVAPRSSVEVTFSYQIEHPLYQALMYE